MDTLLVKNYPMWWLLSPEPLEWQKFCLTFFSEFPPKQRPKATVNWHNGIVGKMKFLLLYIINDSSRVKISTFLRVFWRVKYIGTYTTIQCTILSYILEYCQNFHLGTFLLLNCGRSIHEKTLQNKFSCRVEITSIALGESQGKWKCIKK